MLACFWGLGFRVLGWVLKCFEPAAVVGVASVRGLGFKGLVSLP